MNGPDPLAPDQRALLELVLVQGRSYAQIGDLLRTPVAAVRERAHAAAGVLADAEAHGTREARAAEIADYLLGQQDPGERLVTLASLHDTPADARYARALARALEPMARAPLPEVPGARAVRSRGAVAPGRRRLAAGGALAALAAVAIAALLIRGGGSPDTSSTTPTTPAFTTTSPASGKQGSVQTVATVRLTGEAGTGAAILLRQGNAVSFAVTAPRIVKQPGTVTVLWLEGPSVSPLALGAVTNAQIPKGRLAAAAPVPRTVRRYDTLLVSREPTPRKGRLPAAPSTILLRGALKVPASFGG